MKQIIPPTFNDSFNDGRIYVDSSLMNRYKIIGQQINNNDDVTDQIDRTRSIRQYVYVMTKGKLFGFGCNVEILISKKPLPFKN